MLGKVTLFSNLILGILMPPSAFGIPQHQCAEPLFHTPEESTQEPGVYTFTVSMGCTIGYLDALPNGLKHYQEFLIPQNSYTVKSSSPAEFDGVAGLALETTRDWITSHGRLIMEADIFLGQSEDWFHYRFDAQSARGDGNAKNTIDENLYVSVQILPEDKAAFAVTKQNVIRKPRWVAEAIFMHQVKKSLVESIADEKNLHMKILWQ